MEAIGVVAIAQARCEEILATMDKIGLRDTRKHRTMFLMVEQWMKSLQDVQNVLQDSNLPSHERLLFIRTLEEINDGLDNLRKLFTSFLSKNQRSAMLIRPQKLQGLSTDAESIMRSIENSFSLVHRFLQTANDLQPLRERISHTTSDLRRLREPHMQIIQEFQELLATSRPPTGAPTWTTQQPIGAPTWPPQQPIGAPMWLPQPQFMGTGLQDEMPIDEIREYTIRFPDQMVFENGQNFVLTLKETSVREPKTLPTKSIATARLTKQKRHTTNADELFQQKDGHEGLRKWLQGLRGIQHSPKGFHLVVCGQPTDQGAVTMKDETVLRDVLNTLKVPVTSVHRLLDGIPMLIEHKASPPSNGARFTFRLPLSQNEDWTLGIHWDPSQHEINAFIHGMQDVERLAFSHKLVASLADIQHPMLLPVILCELLTAGDIASVRGTANQLQEVESRTRWSGVFDNVMDVEHANEGARVSFSQMTRTLNVAISRLPTREARTKANVLLVERILECISAIVKKHCEGDNARMNEALLKSTNRLKARLQVLQATQNGLLLEIARETQIASSQLQIVYNLVAQRDNKNNYEMARISLDISRTAKDDSFAMFTLAVMSILFLPGAFIATLFSMDLFDWSAEDGERVINTRFWTYWAIALPLTLIVLIGWLSWLKMHQKNEDRKQRIVPLAASQKTHLSCPNPRHSDVPQHKNETGAHARTSAIDDADVGGGRGSWKVYFRRKASRTSSSLSPWMTPDVEMNNKEDEPSRAAVESAVLVTAAVPEAKSLEQGSMEAAIERSYTFAARGLRRD